MNTHIEESCCGKWRQWRVGPSGSRIGRDRWASASPRGGLGIWGRYMMFLSLGFVYPVKPSMHAFKSTFPFTTKQCEKRLCTLILMYGKQI
ncbi:hypothetical protein Syun_004890 [Stephania yunnanensis]|uniref:Uncharacterized protein n=1 Tax=Stephania yunnanensis TaxID=152371 RepID=A0AAP0Q1P9_9MAGN